MVNSPAPSVAAVRTGPPAAPRASTVTPGSEAGGVGDGAGHGAVTGGRRHR